MNTELLKAKYFLQKGLKKKRKLSQTFHVKNSAPCQSSSRDGHTQCILVSPKSNRVASTQQHHVKIFLNEKNAKLWPWALKYWCFQTVILEKTLENSLASKEIRPVNPKGNHPSTLNIHWEDWCWSRSSNTLATWCKELIHWQRPWCWERVRAGREGSDRGWVGWMVSLTQRTWIWANSRR